MRSVKFMKALNDSVGKFEQALQREELCDCERVLRAFKLLSEIADESGFKMMTGRFKLKSGAEGFFFDGTSRVKFDIYFSDMFDEEFLEIDVACKEGERVVIGIQIRGEE